MGKVHYIGDILFEAKKAFHNLPVELQEVITAQPVTLKVRKEVGKELGSLLPEAIGAYRRLISNG